MKTARKTYRPATVSSTQTGTIFPSCSFTIRKHSYVYGLDPNYLYSKNPDLYKLLQDITNGKTKDRRVPLIREQFGANWVFVDARENDDMIAKLLDSGWAETVYEDNEAQILKIPRGGKGDPPADDVEQEPETPEEKAILDAEEKNAAANDAVNDEEDNGNN